MSGQDGLTTSEGVDEGSAASTAESASTSATSTAESSTTAASDPGHEQAHPGAGEEDGLLGEPPRGATVDGAQDAAPVDTETDEARSARDRLSPGQQVQEGEG